MRLQKFLASAGIASRRACEKLIEEGKVSVNGEVVTQLGTTVDPLKDQVFFEGKQVQLVEEKIYLLLNKPPGYVTTAKDQFGRPTVLDLVSDTGHRVFPVGRLDYNTSGLLILTNDGDLTLQLTHPRHEVFKTYVATVQGAISDEALEQLASGVQLEDFKTSPAKVKLIRREADLSLVELSIREGKYRQVRRMMEAVGHPVESLQRIAIGIINLSGLREGSYRVLSSEEVDYLRRSHA